MDWSTVSMKLDGAKLSQYLYLWYDLNASVSYDKIDGKKIFRKEQNEAN